MADQQLIADEPDIGLDAVEAVRQGVGERALMLVVIVRVGVSQRGRGSLSSVRGGAGQAAREDSGDEDGDDAAQVPGHSDHGVSQSSHRRGAGTAALTVRIIEVRTPEWAGTRQEFRHWTLLVSALLQQGMVDFFVS